MRKFASRPIANNFIVPLPMLAENAYQAGATTVRLAGELRDDKICVEIADDGPGLLQQARRPSVRTVFQLHQTGRHRSRARDCS